MLGYVKDTAIAMAIRMAIMGLSCFYGWLMIIAMATKRLWKGESYWYVKERTLPPLCLSDPQYGRHSYVTVKKLRFHYVENGDRSKPMILFVHGFPEFWFSWRHQLKHFAKDYWVVALDMRGYGDTDKPAKKSEYDIEILKSDVVEFVGALGRESCILVGHDWGGAICWGVAASYPQIVDKLVILNAPHMSAFRDKLLSSPKQFLKSWYVIAFQLPYIPELYLRTEDLETLRDLFENKLSEEELEAFKYVWSKKGAWTPPINYYRMALKPHEVFRPVEVPQIEAPTLVIWGVNDLALEKDLPDFCRPYVKNLQVQYIPKANHFVQQDTPEEVNKAIEQFLHR